MYLGTKRVSAAIVATMIACVTVWGLVAPTAHANAQPKLGAATDWAIRTGAAGAHPAEKSALAPAISSERSFVGDIKVQHIPATMQFALPASVVVDPVYGSSTYPAYGIHFYQCGPTSSACVFIELAENCDVTHCLSGTAVSLPPERGLQCWVFYSDSASGDYASWPCQFSVNAARDTFHFVGTVAPTLTDDPLSVSAQYISGPPQVTTQPDGSMIICPQRREDFADASVTTAGVQYDAVDPSGDVTPQGCGDGAGTADMDAASDILQAHLTFDDQPASPVELNQHGLTGSWFDPTTAGQGFVFEEFPDINLMFIGWFTYDVTAGLDDAQRWYVLSGSVPDGASQIDLSILAAYGGNFAAPPALVAEQVGSATLRMQACTQATLDYFFYDGRQGSVALSRGTENVSCTATGQTPETPSSYLLSGNWYDPASAGQGLQMEFNPGQDIFFAAWYTFVQDGAAGDASLSQRWYTMQAGGFASSDDSVHDIAIYLNTGGVFDDPTAISTTQIGNADLQFHSCTAATLTYQFSDGDNAGLSGSIELARTGPAPAGCAL